MKTFFKTRTQFIKFKRELKRFVMINIEDLEKLNLVNSPIEPLEEIRKIISRPDYINQDAFYIVNLEDVFNKHIQWLKKLPRVEPFYAIKCNTDPMLLKLLSFLGTGFDCASEHEIKTILDLGVQPDRIM